MFLFKENNRYFNNNNFSFNHNNNNNNYDYLNRKNIFSFSRRNPIKIFDYNLNSSNFHKAQNSYTPNINSFNKSISIEEKRNITPFLNINNNNNYINEEKKLFNLKKNRCLNLPNLNQNKFNLLNDYQNSYKNMLLKNKNHISYEKNPFSTSIFNNNNNNNNLSENNINYNNNLKEILSLNDNDLLYPKSDIKNYNISNLSNNIFPSNNNNNPIKNRNSFHYLIPEKKSTLQFISNFMFK